MVHGLRSTPQHRVLRFVTACAVPQEYCAVSVSTLASKPSSLTFGEAAALPLAGLTAAQSLTRANVVAGSKVIVTAGSGGVGSLAIQLAKARGAKVATTCSPRNFDFVKSLGADVTINYRYASLYPRRSHACVVRVPDVCCTRATTVARALRGEQYDAAVDCTNEAFGLLPVLKPKAIVASILSLPSKSNLQKLPAAYNKDLSGCLICCVGCVSWCGLSCCRPSTWCCCGSKEVTGVLTLPYGSDLQRLATMAERQELRPIIYKRFPLAAAVDAMRCLEGGHAVGKVVVDVIPPANGTQAKTQASPQRASPVPASPLA